MFASKNIYGTIRQSIKNIKQIRPYKPYRMQSTSATTTDINIDDAFKNTVADFLKKQNIRHFSMVMDYNSENLTYTETVNVEYFTQNEINNIANNNELNYYIIMSNEFALKN